MVKVNHFLDYKQCTVEELRGFIESRTGKETTSQSVDYLAAKLRDLDKNLTFRFEDLPTEMRLAVYAELLHRPDPSDNKTIHAQILATSKAIYDEAQPELASKGNMVVHMTSRWPSPSIMVAIGAQSMRLFSAESKPAKDTLWPLYDDLTTIVANVENMTIHLDFDPADKVFRSQRTSSKVVQYLFVLTAALRTSQLRKLKLRVNASVRREVDDLLWPLDRIKSNVAFSMEGVSDANKSSILSRRTAEDSKMDSIVKGKELLERADELTALTACLRDPRVSGDVSVLRNRVLRATIWGIRNVGDDQAMAALLKVEGQMGAAGIERTIKKAKAVLEAAEKGRVTA